MSCQELIAWCQWCVATQSGSPCLHYHPQPALVATRICLSWKAVTPAIDQYHAVYSWSSLTLEDGGLDEWYINVFITRILPSESYNYTIITVLWCHDQQSRMQVKCGLLEPPLIILSCRQVHISPFWIDKVALNLSIGGILLNQSLYAMIKILNNTVRRF